MSRLLASHANLVKTRLALGVRVFRLCLLGGCIKLKCDYHIENV